jgi:hypothetical protein
MNNKKNSMKDKNMIMGKIILSFLGLLVPFSLLSMEKGKKKIYIYKDISTKIELREKEWGKSDKYGIRFSQPKNTEIARETIIAKEVSSGDLLEFVVKGELQPKFYEIPQDFQDSFLCITKNEQGNIIFLSHAQKANDVL